MMDYSNIIFNFYKIFSSKKKSLFNFKVKSILNLIKEIITLFFIYLGRDLYIKSLKGCNGDEYSCLHNISFIYEGMNKCIKSSLLFLLILFLIQIKISKYYNLIIIFAFFIEILIKDRGNSFLKHGILNLFGFFGILILGEILIIITLIYIYILKYKKNKKYKIIIITLLFFFFFFNSFGLKEKYHCKNWDRGLNNTYIDNNSTIYSCKIDIPTYKCFIDILGPFLDFSRFIDCKKRKNKEKYLLYSNSNLRNQTNVKRIGFPITINKKQQDITSLYDKTLQIYIQNNLIDMDNLKRLNSLDRTEVPEIILDYTNNAFGELKINVNFNINLSKKRKLLEKNNLSNNIIFIFLDNLSRVHFYRQYKKTTNFLKNFFSRKGYTPKDNKNTYHGFEFLKYHKFDKFTLYNVIPMFSGVNFNSKYKMISILKDYKDNGYITCNIQDICHKELMKIGPFKNYLYIEFDHEYAAPSCDPNIYKTGYDLFYSENGLLKKCLYGKENFEYGLDYARKFWRVYRNNKRFLRIVNTYAHEYSGEKSKYTDNILYKFLKELS